MSHLELAPALAPIHAALAGSWTGTEMLEPTPWVSGGAAEGRLAFAPAAGGNALTLTYATTRAGAELFAMHAVLAPGETEGELRWWWFDSAGHPPLTPATAEWDGATLTITKRTERGSSVTVLAAAGGALKQAITMTPAGSGEPVAIMRGRYARVTG